MSNRRHPLHKDGYQGQYQGNILFRMLGEDVDKMKQFHEDYQAKCHRLAGEKEPSKQDYEIAEIYKREKLMPNEVARKTGMSIYRVNSAINRVARAGYRNA